MADPRNSRRISAILAEIERLKALLVYADADQRANVAFLKLFAGRLGLTSFQGLSFDDFFVSVRRKKIEEVLIQCEDSDPGLAARLQEILEEGENPN